MSNIRKIGATSAWLVCAAAGCLAGATPCAGQDKDEPAPAPPAPTPGSPTPQSSEPQAGSDGSPNEIVVEGSRLPAQPADGKSYDQTGNPVAETGSGADVLNTVPSVNVTPDGTVSLRGREDVEVLINGRRSAATSGADRGLVLQSMAGSDIASIEVVTNPSARYGQSGAGIINIVLKPNRERAGRANLTANFGTQGRKNGSLNARQTSGDFSANLTVGAREDFRQYEETTSTRHRNNQGRFLGRREQARSFDARRFANNVVASAEYQWPDTTLGAELSRSENSASNPITEINRQFDENGALISEFARLSSGPRRHVETGVSVNLDHAASNGSDWRLALHDTWTYDHSNKTYRDIFATPETPDIAVRVLTNTRRHVMRAAGDGVMAVRSKSQLSIGFDFQRTSDEYVNLYAGLDPFTGEEIVDADLTSDVAVVRSVGAGYATYQASIGDLTILAGLRLEIARSTIDLGVAPGQLSHTDSNLNPSLHLRLPLTEDAELTANVSQSSQRPDLVDLNPFPVYQDSENFTSGNPALRPQRITSAELGYSSKLGKLDQTVTAYFRQSRNTVTDFSYLVADDVLLTTKRNAGQGLSTGVVYALSGKLTSKLKLTASANLFYAQVEALDLAGRLHNSGTSYDLQAALDYSLTEKDQLHVDAAVRGDTIRAQGSQSGTVAFNASWVHRFRPQLSLSLRINDITGGSTVRTSVETAAVSRLHTSAIRRRAVFVGIQYGFR